MRLPKVVHWLSASIRGCKVSAEVEMVRSSMYMDVLMAVFCSRRLSKMVNRELIDKTLRGQPWKSAVELKGWPHMLLSLKKRVLVV